MTATPSSRRSSESSSYTARVWQLARAWPAAMESGSSPGARCTALVHHRTRACGGNAVADPKFDPAAHAAQAPAAREHSRRKARAALRADIVERTSRLGRSATTPLAAAYGAEQQVAADQSAGQAGVRRRREVRQRGRHVRAARHAELEHAGVDRGTAEIAADLREQAAEQRALAEAAPEPGPRRIGRGGRPAAPGGDRPT